MIDRKKIGRRTVQTNRRVWKIRILQHIGRRGKCWESMPNIAKALRIGKRRLTRYLEELRAAGKIQTTYRVRTTHIHMLRTSCIGIFPSKIDDAGLTPKQANALTALFKFGEISMADIGQQTLCSANTARRAVWKAMKLGLLKIIENPGFVHRFIFASKVIRCLGKRTPKRFHRPLSQLHQLKHSEKRKHGSVENLRTSCDDSDGFQDGDIPY